MRSPAPPPLGPTARASAGATGRLNGADVLSTPEQNVAGAGSGLDHYTFVRHAQRTRSDGISESMTLQRVTSTRESGSVTEEQINDLRAVSLLLVELCVLKALDTHIPGAPDDEIRALMNRIRATVAGAPDLAMQLVPTLKRLLSIQPAAVCSSLIRCDSLMQLVRLLQWLHASAMTPVVTSARSSFTGTTPLSNPPAQSPPTTPVVFEIATVLADVIAATGDAAYAAMRSEALVEACFALLLSGWHRIVVPILAGILHAPVEDAADKVVWDGLCEKYLGLLKTSLSLPFGLDLTLALLEGLQVCTPVPLSACSCTVLHLRQYARDVDEL